MNPYLRFSIITLFFTVCIVYVLTPKYGDISIEDKEWADTSIGNKGWTFEDKQEFISNCIDGGIGSSEELCYCMLAKLQSKFSGLQDMFSNPQMPTIMKTASSECKK